MFARTSLGESLAKSHAYNAIRESPRVSERASTRLLVRLSARLLARLFALAKRLSRVSDRIICTTLCKTLSETRFFTRAVIKRCCVRHFQSLGRVFFVCSLRAVRYREIENYIQIPIFAFFITNRVQLKHLKTKIVSQRHSFNCRKYWRPNLGNFTKTHLHARTWCDKNHPLPLLFDA